MALSWPSSKLSFKCFPCKGSLSSQLFWGNPQEGTCQIASWQLMKSLFQENDRTSTPQFHLHTAQYWLTEISVSISPSSAVWTCPVEKVTEQCVYLDRLCLHQPRFSAPSQGSQAKVVTDPFLAMEPPPSPGFSPKNWGLSVLACSACSAPAWSYHHTQRQGTKHKNQHSRSNLLYLCSQYSFQTPPEINDSESNKPSAPYAGTTVSENMKPCILKGSIAPASNGAVGLFTRAYLRFSSMCC